MVIEFWKLVLSHTWNHRLTEYYTINGLELLTFQVINIFLSRSNSAKISECYYTIFLHCQGNWTNFPKWNHLFIGQLVHYLLPSNRAPRDLHPIDNKSILVWNTWELKRIFVSNSKRTKKKDEMKRRDNAW